MVAPTTSYPASTKSAAATDESTPPDIATSTRPATGAPHPVARGPVCPFPAGPVLLRATCRRALVRRSAHHRCNTADSCRTLSTIFGSAPMTVSTSSAALSLPNENRSAATPSSRGTAIAVSTCDGSTAPVEQAEPEEQALPAGSQCISVAPHSVPGIDTLVTCGARRPCAALITASGTTASSP